MKKLPYALRGMILFSTFSLLLFLIIRCEDEKPFIREYPRLTATSVTNISDSGATFSADLYSLGTEIPVEYGFLWGINDELSYNASNKVILGKPQSTGLFTADIRSGLIKEKQYILKPFVKTEDRVVYGPSSEFKSLGSNAPVIFSFSPDSAGWGDTIKISGKNFSWVLESNEVKLNQISCTIAGSTDTTLYFIVDQQIKSPKNGITVSLAGNVNSYTKDSLSFLSPVLYDYLPKSGCWGDTLMLRGKHFGKNVNLLQIHKITLSNKNCPVLITQGDSLILIRIPDEINTISNNLNVTLNGFVLTGSVPFTLNPPYFSILPKNGTWGAAITLKGRFNSIASRNKILFNNIQATIRSVNTTQMTILVPTSLSVAKSLVRYQVTPFDIASSDTFKLIPPVIKSFLPVSGMGGTPVTIRGKYFGKITPMVKFGTSSATVISFNDSTIVTRVPATGFGIVNIFLTVTGQNVTSGGTFNMENPSIFSISPQSGTFNDEVTITGTNLIPATGNTTVSFNGISATIKSLTSNSIKVNVPLTIDSIPQSIIVSAGANYSTSTQKFILNPPKIFSVSSGTFATGQDIIIAGSNFNPAAMNNKVLWGSNPLVVKSATTTEIVATIPVLPRGTNRIKLIIGGYSVFSSNVYNVNSSWLSISVPKIITSYMGTGSDYGEKNYGGSINGYGYIVSRGMGSTTYKFDPANNSMTDLKILAFDNPGYWYLHMGEVVCKSKFYLISGTGNGGFYIYGYNPILNSWKSSPINTGPAYVPGVGFGLNDKIYFGLNYDNANRNFWEYNPDTDKWTKLTDFPGSPSFPFSTYFTLKNKGYVVFSDNQVWQFDPDLLVWSRKSDFPGQRRQMSVSFALSGFGYMGTGKTSSTILNDLWKYDPDTDTWTSLPGLPNARYSAVSFTINNKAYVGFGRTNLTNDLFDFYEYDPNFPAK